MLLSREEQERLIAENQRYIYYFIKKHISVNPNEIEEITAIGRLGLTKAAATFDDSRGVKFITYASKLIKNEIFMYLRAKRKCPNYVSLNESITDDGKNDIERIETIPNSDTSIQDKVAAKGLLEKTISIILNFLNPKERLIMLYEISGKTQTEISSVFNFSQSYASRMIVKIREKVKSYLGIPIRCREVFRVAIVEDYCRISFESRDVKQFNKIFATLLQNITSTETLPDFKVICDRERITVIIPAYPEAFSFIAQIIQEIDNFSLKYFSNRTLVPEEKNDTKDAIERKKDVIPEDDERKETVVPEDAESKENMVPEAIETEKDMVLETAKSEEVETPETRAVEESMATVEEQGENECESEVVEERQQPKEKVSRGMVMYYILKQENFTIKELKEYFGNVYAIPNAINYAKRHKLITSTDRGEYRVNKK